MSAEERRILVARFDFSSGSGILRRVEFVAWLVLCSFETKMPYAARCLGERNSTPVNQNKRVSCSFEWFIGKLDESMTILSIKVVS